MRIVKPLVFQKRLTREILKLSSLAVLRECSCRLCYMSVSPVWMVVEVSSRNLDGGLPRESAL